MGDSLGRLLHLACLALRPGFEAVDRERRHGVRRRKLRDLEIRLKIAGDGKRRDRKLIGYSNSRAALVFRCDDRDRDAVLALQMR
jgi:hypothetical protein